MNPVYEHQLQAAAQEEQKRLERFKAAWDAYYGRLEKPLRVKAGQPDDNVQVNYCRTIVDAGIAFLFGEDLPFELEDEANVDSTDASPAELWLTDAWRANKKMTLLQKLAMNGAVCGQAFVKIVATTPYPRIVVLDPATVTPRPEPDDIDVVNYYRIQYTAVDPQTGKPIAIRQIIQRQGATWLITDMVSRASTTYRGGIIAGDWVTTGESVWPFDWPPILGCQNLPAPNEYWGISDLESDIVDVNKAMNFGYSNTNRIIRFHAHPKTWGSGFNTKDVDVSVDAMLVFGNKDAQLHNLEMQSDLSSSIEYLARLKEAFHVVTRTPEISTGKLDSVGQLSGLAMGILYGPLLQKTNQKRLTYGDLVSELNRRLLELGNYGADNRVESHWPAMLPVDTKAEAETAVLKEQIGVSKDTLLQELGYDPAIERKKRDEEAATAGDTLLAAFERGQLQGQTPMAGANDPNATTNGLP